MEAPRNLLTDLPRDLFYEILRFLSPGSRVRLALTSKALLGVIQPDGIFPTLDTMDYLDLLLYQESISKDLYLCFDCNRLHRFDPACRFNWFADQRHCDASAISGLSYSLVARSELYSQLHTDAQPGQSAKPVDTIVERSAHGGFCGSGYFIRCGKPESGMLHPLLSWCPGMGYDTAYDVYRFEEVHLVMNRHFYGTGLPLESLTQHFEFERKIDVFQLADFQKHFPLWVHQAGCTVQRRACKPAYGSGSWEPFSWEGGEVEPKDLDYTNGFWAETQATHDGEPLGFALPWAFKHQTEAKIIKDELYISSSHKVTGPAVPESRFVDLIKSLKLPVCGHVYGPGVMPKDLYKFSWHLDECPVSTGNVVRSCTVCPTDYRTLLNMDEDQQRWEFVLETYHRVGPCRTPLDSAWARLARLESRKPPCPEVYGTHTTGIATDMAIPQEGDVLAAWHNRATDGAALTQVPPRILEPQLNQFIVFHEWEIRRCRNVTYCHSASQGGSQLELPSFWTKAPGPTVLNHWQTERVPGCGYRAPEDGQALDLEEARKTRVWDSDSISIFT